MRSDLWLFAAGLLASSVNAAAGGGTLLSFPSLMAGGLSPILALKAGTSADAELLGIANQVGTLEPGKLADVIAVPGDVLKDPTSVERVLLVVKEGKVVKAP